MVAWHMPMAYRRPYALLRHPWWFLPNYRVPTCSLMVIRLFGPKASIAVLGLHPGFQLDFKYQVNPHHLVEVAGAVQVEGKSD